jgi:hypothetical protein
MKGKSTFKPQGHAKATSMLQLRQRAGKKYAFSFSSANFCIILL